MSKIASPGIYDLSFETYFQDCCVGHSVSSTGLKVIEQKSLKHYHWQSYLNPQREPFDTPAMAFGRACHALVLGEPIFAKHYVIAPHDEFNKNPGKAWHSEWKERVAAGLEHRTLVRPKQFASIEAMIATLKGHKLLRNVFVDGVPERSVIFKDKETGIWIKTRPDWLPNNLRLVPDLKTTVSAKPDAFARQAFNLGYHQSAALTIDGLREVLGWGDAQYYFVAQEKEPPYVALPFVMRDTDIEMGRMLNRSALRKLARALDRNEWPAYAEGATEIEMPAWQEKQFLDRHAAGEFTDENGQEKAA